MIIFSNQIYLLLAASIFVAMLVSLCIVSEFLFIAPFVVFYVPHEAILSFSLIVVVSALSGLVICMSIYRMRLICTSLGKGSSGFLGALIGASAGACSCGSIGFAIVSSFGAYGAIATAFLTNYEIPLRIISIGILIFTYYLTVKGLASECKIQN